jgi:hypothetical protein
MVKKAGRIKIGGGGAITVPFGTCFSVFFDVAENFCSGFLTRLWRVVRVMYERPSSLQAMLYKKPFGGRFALCFA